MHGRRGRTFLPINDALLQAPANIHVPQRIDEAKKKQAFYYNRNTKIKKPILKGQTVRVKLNDTNNWTRAEVAEVLPFRSYKVQMNEGSEFRQNAKHVRSSNEPPLIFEDMVPEGPASTNMPPHQESEIIQKETLIKEFSPMGSFPQQLITNRYGRIIKKPRKDRTNSDFFF